MLLGTFYLRQEIFPARQTSTICPVLILILSLFLILFLILILLCILSTSEDEWAPQAQKPCSCFLFKLRTENPGALTLPPRVRRPQWQTASRRYPSPVSRSPQRLHVPKVQPRRGQPSGTPPTYKLLYKHEGMKIKTGFHVVTRALLQFSSEEPKSCEKTE